MSSINNGASRNNIRDLETLNDNLYENIFKVNIIENSDKNFFFYNTLNKIIFPDNIDATAYLVRNIEVDTPWTILSFNIYGTINLWWVLYLLNKPKYIFLAKAGTTIKYIKPSVIGSILRRMVR